MKNLTKRLFAVLLTALMIVSCMVPVYAADSPSKTKLTSGNVTVKSYTYNGKKQTTKVVVKVNGKKLTAGTDYKVTGTTKAKNAGTYTVKVTGKGLYTGTVKKTWTIAKKAQSLKATISGKTSVTVKASSMKKKAKTYTVKTKGAKGKVTYTVSASKSKYKKYISVNSKGKVTLKKGIKKGTYTVKVTSAATTNYKKATKTIKIKVK